MTFGVGTAVFGVTMGMLVKHIGRLGVFIAGKITTVNPSDRGTEKQVWIKLDQIEEQFLNSFIVARLEHFTTQNLKVKTIFSNINPNTLKVLRLSTVTHPAEKHFSKC